MKKNIEKIFPLARDLRCLSKSIWLYTLVVLIDVARKTIFNVMNEVGDYSSVNQSSVLLLIFMFFALIIVLHEKNRINKSIKQIRPIMVYHLFGFFSFIWAGYYFPIMMKAGEVILAILLMFVIIYKIPDKRVCLTYILFWCFIPIIFDLVSRRFSYFHTNLYTFSAAMGLMICLGGVRYGIYRLKEVRNLIALFILFIVIGTSSASYIAAIIGLIVFAGCDRRGIKIARILLVVGLVLVLWHFGEDMIKHYVFYGKDETTINSGTGRKEIWNAYWEMIKEKPVLGWGFLVGERMLSTVFSFEVQVISAHNSFMSAIVGMGVVGLMFFINFIIDWLKILYRKSIRHNQFALTLLPAFVVFFVNTNSFPAIGTDWNYVGTAAYAMYAFCKMKI